GFRVGDAQVSEKHCGFVINKGNASCSDVIELCERVKAIVKEKTGYMLELEPVIIGEL
ncbi:MAG: UDP-N-acetylenolpyruvoylglucosamine reductase, partial [Ruminococcus sp.]